MQLQENTFVPLVNALVQNATQPLCVFDEHGDILNVNPAFAELCEVSGDQLEDVSVFKLVNIPPDDLHDLKADMHRSKRYIDKTLRSPSKGHKLPVDIVLGSYVLYEGSCLFYAFVTDTRTWQENEVMKRRMLLLVRQRDISADLHDTIGQNLALLKMHFEQIESASKQGSLSDEHFTKYHELLDVSQKQIRNFIRHLREDESIRAIDCLWNIPDVLRYARDNLSLDVVDLGLSNLSSLDPHVERHAVQMIRECLMNIYKHANVSHAWLTVTRDDEFVHIAAVDKGEGFDTDEPKEGHYGLKIMEEKVNELNGQFAVLSTPGEGCHVFISLPYYQQKKG